MSSQAFRPIAYLKEDCPYSFKFLLFMSEAQLLDRIEVVRCNPEGEQCERIKAKLASATNKRATFPTVEIEPGKYLSDSDRLIEHFARIHGIDAAQLPALTFYKKGIFPQLEQLH